MKAVKQHEVESCCVKSLTFSTLMVIRFSENKKDVSRTTSCCKWQTSDW